MAAKLSFNYKTVHNMNETAGHIIYTAKWYLTLPSNMSVFHPSRRTEPTQGFKKG